jgi:hypothetical protein
MSFKLNPEQEYITSLEDANMALSEENQNFKNALEQISIICEENKHVRQLAMEVLFRAEKKKSGVK